ncbi:3503_t:CDS:2, partial [Dentiscutata heterogama]
TNTHKLYPLLQALQEKYKKLPEHQQIVYTREKPSSVKLIIQLKEIPLGLSL